MTMACTGSPAPRPCRAGDRIASVFEVDTLSGGSLVGVLWRINGTWVISSEKSRILHALHADEGDVFPFEWSYVVPLARDLYHD